MPIALTACNCDSNQSAMTLLIEDHRVEHQRGALVVEDLAEASKSPRVEHLTFVSHTRH